MGGRPNPEGGSRRGTRPGQLSLGAYVTVGCHSDLTVARRLVTGTVAAFAHFSAMPGSTGAGLAERDRSVVAEVGRRYDSNEHLSNEADHTAPLDADFIDRFAVVGPPERCADRLRDLARLGVDRFVLTGPGFRSDRADARTSADLVTNELLPALQEEAS